MYGNIYEDPVCSKNQMLKIQWLLGVSMFLFLLLMKGKFVFMKKISIHTVL